MSVVYPLPVQHVKVFGQTDMAWCECGKGDKTLLFVHGLAGYLPVWTAQMKELGKQYRCVAVDLPGNGLSANGNYPWSVSFFAETLAGFIEELQLKNVILVGHSMGGQVSLRLAHLFPHLIEALVLVAPSGLEYFYPHEVMMMEHALDFGKSMGIDERYLDISIRQSFFTAHPSAEGIISDLRNLLKEHQFRHWHDMVLGCIKGMLREPMQPLLPEISTPALILFGLRDAMIPNRLVHPTETVRSVGKTGEALMQNARAVFIEDAGHFVMIEKIKEVNENIASFILSL